MPLLGSHVSTLVNHLYIVKEMVYLISLAMKTVQIDVILINIYYEKRFIDSVVTIFFSLASLRHLFYTPSTPNAIATALPSHTR